MIKHVRDVDTIHYGNSADRQWQTTPADVGHIHGPGMQQWSGPASPKATAHAPVLVDHYFLTGDRRSLDVARLCGRAARKADLLWPLYVELFHSLANACEEIPELRTEANQWHAAAREAAKRYNIEAPHHPLYDIHVAPGLLRVNPTKAKAYLAKRNGVAVWLSRAAARHVAAGGEGFGEDWVRATLLRRIPDHSLPLPIPKKADALVDWFGGLYPIAVRDTSVYLWQVPYLLELANRRGLTEADLLNKTGGDK